jgi:hypothetical protein
VGPEGIDVRPAAADGATPWSAVTVEGVSLELPSSKEWRIDVVVNPCSTTLAKWVLLENKALDARIKIDLSSGSIDAVFPGSEHLLDAITGRIHSTLKGKREVPSEVARFAPFPTSSACDPRTSGVPTLRPLPEDTPGPVTTVGPGATPTSVIPPVP